MHKLGLLLAVSALFAFGCGGDDDDDGDGVDAGADAASATVFQVTLTTAEEVPACAGAGATATGSATVTVNAAGTEVAVTDLTWSNLSGDATAAHIHPGATGVAGAVALGFSAAGTPPTNPTDRTFVAADYASPAGGPADFSAFVTALLAGDAYINVHTAACPMGEIRGQID